MPAMLNNMRIVLLFLLWTLFSPHSHAENDANAILVIANPSVPMASISRKELAAIYLLRVTLWPDGQTIVPVNQDSDNPLRGHFSDRVLRQTPAILANYWNQMHFQGKNPPLVLESDEAVNAFVRKVPGAIGYVNANTPTQGVKVMGYLP